MIERDIQNYLYAHPEVLFPAGNITESAKEYRIQGKRIDLLFVVDGVRYIVEIKNVPIQREHIGQVVEYYGLMRQYMKDANLAMMLVSPSIPSWRAAYLEELGIRCVEMASVPSTPEDAKRISKKRTTYDKKFRQKAAIKVELRDGEQVTYDDIACSVSPKGMAFAFRMLDGSLESIRNTYKEYEIIPFGITRPSTQDYDLEYSSLNKHGIENFSKGGIWWAYRFGFSEEMPKNDVPNISIIANSTGLDVTLNAELQSSQKVMIDRIRSDLPRFDRLLADHGGLWLKTYLKYEHQPRFFHWILADLEPPGEFSGTSMLHLVERHKKAFNQERQQWIQYITANNNELSRKQVQQLEEQNRRLNLAIRLVEPFKKDASFWSMPQDRQMSEIVGSVQRLKPLIDFFVR